MATFAQIDSAFPSADEPTSAVTAGSNEPVCSAQAHEKHLRHPSFFRNSASSNLTRSGDSHHSRSPLSGLGFLKGLTNSEKKPEVDGQQPKRRGPKPDSKPALTRRQQLNRQAQRTHRERKELYIKALEQEVLRLKDIYCNSARERDVMAQENKQLRELLAAHGIQLPNGLTPPPDRASSGSISGSYASTRGQSPPSNGASGQAGGNLLQPAGGGLTKLDYDQIGIDFVLALERPCMDHMQMLCVKSNDSEADISGHALMATCPPQNHLLEQPETQYPHKLPDLQSVDLIKLLDLSNRLPLDGEITPIMAWASILRNDRMKYLEAQDFKSITDDLLAKVRCYGFGAVLEEFEVGDCLEMTLVAKSDNKLTIHDSQPQDQVMVSADSHASTTVQALA